MRVAILLSVCAGVAGAAVFDFGNIRGMFGGGKQIESEPLIIHTAADYQVWESWLQKSSSIAELLGLIDQIYNLAVPQFKEKGGTLQMTEEYNVEDIQNKESAKEKSILIHSSIKDCFVIMVPINQWDANTDNVKIIGVVAFEKNCQGVENLGSRLALFLASNIKADFLMAQNGEIKNTQYDTLKKMGLKVLREIYARDKSSQEDKENHLKTLCEAFAHTFASGFLKSSDDISKSFTPENVKASKSNS